MIMNGVVVDCLKRSYEGLEAGAGLDGTWCCVRVELEGGRRVWHVI